MKPRIKWWGNGDVHAGCFDTYRLCYPNDIATFRTDFISMPKLTKRYFLPITITSLNKTP